MLDEEIVLDFNSSFDILKLVDILSATTLADDYISIDLETIISKTLTLVVSLTEVNNKINIFTTGTADVSGNITYSESNVDDIVVPTDNLLYPSDVCEILDYAVSAYNLSQKKIYDLNIDTYIYKSDNTYFHIYGDVKFELVDGIKNINALVNVYVVEYRKNKQYGWHQINLTIIGAGTDTGMVYGSYGNNENNKSKVIKVYTTYTGVLELVHSVMDLMKIDTFNNIVSDSTSFKLDLDKIINSISLNSSLDLVINQDAINKNMHKNHLLNVSLTKIDGRLALVELDNLFVTFVNETNYTVVKDTAITFNPIDSLVVSAPTSLSGYYDLTNMSYLFEALYNDAQIKDFAIDGTVTLKALSIVNINVPISAKVHVCEDGTPEVLISIEVPYVIFVLEKKTLNIYYKDGFIYLNRIDDDGDCYLLKISYQTFMSNPLEYMFGEYGMGMPSLITDLISDSDAEGDGFVDASECVNSVSIGTKEFAFNLDMGEIADNSSLGNMDIKLGTTDIQWTNEDGSKEIRTILSTINKFTFDMVSSAIQLNGSGLKISNIKTVGDHNVMTSVDMTSYYNFINSFNENYVTDAYYKGSNSSYSYQGKLTHTATFDFGGVIENKRINTFEGTIINFPYNNLDVIKVGDEYYQLTGWYKDASYNNKIENLNNVLMPAKNVKYRALLENITEIVNNSSYYVKYNGELTEISSNSTQALFSSDVAFFDGANYLVVDSSKLTGNILINNYLSLFEYNDGKMILDLYDLSDLSSYNIVNINVLDNYNNNIYKAVLFDESIDLSSYLPKCSNEDLQINYWTDDNGQEYTIDMLDNVNSSMNLTAHYSTSSSHFTFQEVEGKAKLISYSGSLSTVILPKYVYINSKYVVLDTIGSSAFMDNTNVVNVVLNEGLTTISNDAFKNCSSLRKVYFPNSVTSVATDAFYIDNVSKYETNRDNAKEIRFYFTTSSSIKESTLQSWLACKWNSNKKYYENKYSLLGSGDFRDAYQTYSGSLDSIINNLI